LFKKRKKVNTTFEFLADLKLEKEAKAALDALIKKLKNALEEEKKKIRGKAVNAGRFVFAVKVETCQYLS